MDEELSIAIVCFLFMIAGYWLLYTEIGILGCLGVYLLQFAHNIDSKLKEKNRNYD